MVSYGMVWFDDDDDEVIQTLFIVNHNIIHCAYY